MNLSGGEKYKCVEEMRWREVIKYHVREREKR